MSIYKYSIHVDDTGRFPLGEITVERNSIIEHLYQDGNTGRIPHRDIAVEHFGVGEHTMHVDDTGCHPL
jgi:hypothetical protein